MTPVDTFQRSLGARPVNFRIWAPQGQSSCQISLIESLEATANNLDDLLRHRHPVSLGGPPLSLQSGASESRLYAWNRDRLALRFWLGLRPRAVARLRRLLGGAVLGLRA